MTGAPLLESAPAAPAAPARTARLLALLDLLLDGEPPAAPAPVADVYRRAEHLRRRRIAAAAGTAVAAIVAVVALGYGATWAVLPRSAERTVAIRPATATAPADPVLSVLRPVTPGLTVTPRHAQPGTGWRRYAVRGPDGRPRGLIEISVYPAPVGVCFPVLADDRVCARPDRAGRAVEYVRYAFDGDLDRQVVEVLARRSADGRVVVVQASGPRGTGDVYAGRPPLTAPQAVAVAADARVAAGFAPTESCAGADRECPVLRVPVTDRVLRPGGGS